jgi:hypothetical protein
MKAARAAAVLTWVYAAGFGLPVIPVSGYLLSRGRLLTFFDLFSEASEERAVAPLAGA